MMRRWFGPFGWGCVIVLALAQVTPQSQSAPAGETSLASLALPAVPPEPLVCGTPAIRAREARGLQAVAVADLTPVFFHQVPQILRPDHNGELRFAGFVVTGDVGTVQFTLDGRDQPDTWTRTTTANLGGRLVSVFEPSFPPDAIGTVLSRRPFGWDQPFVHWGRLSVPGGGTFNISVRVAPSSMPASRVIRLNETIQYASHVVNIHIPGYGDSRLTDDQDFDQEIVARQFYEHFADAYEGLAIVPQAMHVTTGFDAFHTNTRNDVQGINVPVGSRAGDFGSGGTLHGVEVFTGGSLGDNAVSTHEIAHQWGDHYDYAAIAGVPAGGTDPGSHSPLWFPGPSYLGAVLHAVREVGRSQGVHGGEFHVQASGLPIFHHPYQLYQMGKIPPDQVPDLLIFENQGQFGARSAPSPGTPVQGNGRTVTINDILGRYGARSGPVFDVWRRATIVVSRDGLISQEEMNYWNFIAQRLEDPGRTGVMSCSGELSHDGATRNSMDLQTDITPRSAEKIVDPHPVEKQPFGPTDLRGVQFDAPIPSVFQAGQQVRLSGRVTATDRSDFHAIIVLLRSQCGTSSAGEIVFQESISPSGNFSVNMAFAPEQRGVYAMGVFLFFPNAGSQAARTILTPVFVE